MYKIARAQIYLILLAALFLQGGLFSHLKAFGAAPDLLAMCVIFFALFLGPSAGLEAGMAAGIMKDIFALDYLWVNAAALAVTGFIVGSLNEQLFKESKRAEFIFVLIFTALSMAVHYALVRILSGSMMLGFGEFFSASIAPASIYTAILSVPAYRILLDMYDLKETEDYL